MSESVGIIEDLGIDNADEVVIFPYADVKDEDWPTYTNQDGVRVPIPKGWAHVGYRYPYPTPKRTSKVREFSSGLSMSGNQEEINIKTRDPEALAKHLTHNLIKGIVRKRPGGEPQEETLDEKLRKWLFGELCKSSFLLSGAYVQYLREGGKAAEEDSAEEEVFTGP